MGVMSPLIRTIGGEPALMCRSEAPCSLTSLRMASIRAMKDSVHTAQPATRATRATGPDGLDVHVFGKFGRRLEPRWPGLGIPSTLAGAGPIIREESPNQEKIVAEYVEKHRAAVRISMPGDEPQDGQF